MREFTIEKSEETRKLETEIDALAVENDWLAKVRYPQHVLLTLIRGCVAKNS